MITQETAGKIWTAYRELANAEKLLDDIEKRTNEGLRHDRHARTLPDAFGRKQPLQLGIPMGKGSHQLPDVAPDLADVIIKAHMENQKCLLSGLNVQAGLEQKRSLGPKAAVSAGRRA